MWLKIIKNQKSNLKINNLKLKNSKKKLKINKK